MWNARHISITVYKTFNVDPFGVNVHGVLKAKITKWFVIASYTVEVYEELQRYKSYFRKVSDLLGKRMDVYAKQLRDNATMLDKKTFIGCAEKVFYDFCSDKTMVEESSQRLWRFVTDYAWWSGQKTIYRGDFYISVILNLNNKFVKDHNTFCGRK